jgi:spoIIIJ-associated protein
MSDQIHLNQDSGTAPDPDTRVDSAAEAAEPTTGSTTEGESAHEGAADAAAQSASTEPNQLSQLESEGDAAADFLEDLLDIADLDGDIDLDVDNGRAAVSIVGGDLGVLVGPDGAVLEALQELTRLAVLRETGERSRLMLDVAGHRAARRAALEQEAAEASARVRGSGEPLRLAPMTPFERKVVHDAVAAAGLRSESEGEEPQRRVVVLPAADEGS